MRFASQGNRRQHTSTVGLNITLQVRQCTAHADEVVNHYVHGTGLNRTIKFGLPSQTGESICTGVGDDIGLHHVAIHGPRQRIPQLIRKNFGDGVDAFLLKRMRTNQYWSLPGQQFSQLFDFSRVDRVTDQGQSSRAIAGFRRPISRMLLDRRFGRVNQHIRKFTPRSAWRLHGRDVITQNFLSYSL